MHSVEAADFGAQQATLEAADFGAQQATLKAADFGAQQATLEAADSKTDSHADKNSHTNGKNAYLLE